MDRRTLLGLVVLSGVTHALLTGCPSPAPPENAVTWGVKAASGQLTNATAREWQCVAEKIDEATPRVDVVLNDEQAAALVDFVQANELNTLEQIVALVEQAQQDPNTVADLVIPDSVTALINSGGLDDLEAAVDDTMAAP